MSTKGAKTHPIHPAEVASVLGGETVLGRKVRTLDDLRRMVQDGLPTTSLNRVAERVAGYHVTPLEISHTIVPRATLHRRRGRLSPAESERLERLARVAALAESVWEDPALAQEFLNSAQPQLGGLSPVQLVRSDLGARQVEELLFKLEYGLPA